MRRVLLLGAALFATAAAPTFPPLALVTPLGPPAPGGAGAGFLPAPVPNPDLASPPAASGRGAGPSVAPSFFHPEATYQGEGYLRGSTYEGDQERRLRPSPGLNLTLPIQ
jgi:hypothetical protein